MNIKILLSVLSLIFFSTTAYAAPKPETIMAASEFVILLMEDADNLSNLPENLQEDALLKLVNRSFNIPRVGRFVIGRYWRRATIEQRYEFLEVFEQAAVRTFSPLVKGISLDKFEIDRVTFDLKNNKIKASVYSTLTTEDRVIKIRWMLRDYSDGYQIIDIIAEGISLIVTLRSEYTTYIKNHSIDDLITKLQEQGK